MGIVDQLEMHLHIVKCNEICNFLPFDFLKAFLLTIYLSAMIKTSRDKSSWVLNSPLFLSADTLSVMSTHVFLM